MTDTRIGLVGCGTMGARHYEALQSIPGAQVTALCDSDAERCRSLAKGCEDVAICGDVEELARSDIDGVIIATPDTAHRAPAETLAAAGIPIFLEKPLASTLEDADAIIDACDRFGVPLAVGQILRFEPSYLTLQQGIRDGRIGRFVSAFLRRHSLQTVAERLAPETNVLDYLSVHDFDQLRWANPAPVESVTARAAHGPIYRRHGSPDAVYTTIGFADGSIACVESAWSLTSAWGGTGADPTWRPFGDVRFDVYGSDGFISLDLRCMNVIGASVRHGFMAPENRHWPNVHGRIGGALREELIDFIQCLRTGSRPAVDGYAARRAIVLVEAAKRSLAAGGVPVAVAEDREYRTQTETQALV